MKESMMKRKKIDELVRTGSSLAPVPLRTREKVLGLMRDKAGTKPRPSFQAILRYTPAYALALVLVLVVPIVSVLAFRLFFPSGRDNLLVVVSNKGGSVLTSPGKLTAGRVIGKSEVVVTGPSEQVSLRSKKYYDMDMFSGSALEVDAYHSGTRAVDISLREGSLYVNEYAAVRDGRLVTVLIDRYICVLTGTRVYFAVSSERIIRIICFDGGVEVSSESGGAKVILFVLAKGEKAEIAPNGSYRIFGASHLTPEELDFDRLLVSTVSPTTFYRELPWSEWSDGAGEDGNAAASTEASLPPYSVTAMCNISPKIDEGGNARFFASAFTGGRLFLLNRESVFVLVGARPVPVKGIPRGAAFRVRPVTMKNMLCIPAATALLFADPVSLAVIASVTLPPDGSIDHDFVPFFDSGILYVPVQNYGYYETNAGTGTLSLDLVVREPFPVSPRKRDGILYTGSYYDNYVAAYDGHGAAVFKARVPDGAVTNFGLDSSGVYVQTVGNGVASIVRFSRSGEENGRWALPGVLKADFILFDGKIAGITEGGIFFVLDTASGRVTVSKKVFGTTLTSREWRTIAPLLANGKLYVQSDSGTIFVVDPGRAAVEDEIRASSTEPLYSAPVFADGALYCIGNMGTVYRIVKNER
jgi:hypothetical protein